MKKIRLGKTGLLVTEVGFGGIPIVRESEEKALTAVLKAIDCGINFIDTANGYKDSEEKIGKAIKPKRDELVLATKSGKRNKSELLKDIDNSLKMLQTDRIELFQLHQVSKDEEIATLFDENGPYEGALEAQKAGKILHIGVTSHRLQAAITLVRTGKFETIQFPFNFIETESLETWFPEALENDMGCIVMKPLAGGVISDAGLAFRYLQQYPQLVPIPGMSEVKEIEQNISFYTNKQPLTDEDKAKIENLKTELGTEFCRRCGYCEPCPSGVSIFVGMSLPRIIKNYGVDYQPKWVTDAADQINFCTECRLCETKCPYNLPIRDILKKNKEFYDKSVFV